MSTVSDVASSLLGLVLATAMVAMVGISCLRLLRRAGRVTLVTVTIAIGGGFTLLVLLGLALHVTSVGVTRTTWALGLVGCLGVLNLVPLRRRPSVRRVPGQVPTSQRLKLGAAVAIMAIALVASAAHADRSVRRTPEELWGQRHADGVLIGVRSGQSTSDRHTVEVHCSERLLERWETATLREGRSWTRNVESFDVARCPSLRLRLLDGATERELRSVTIGSTA